MTLWYEGPLAALGVRATGADAEQDRIVSAALVTQPSAGSPTEATRWLLDPGPPVPTAAGAVPRPPGPAPGECRRPGPAVEEMARALAGRRPADAPLVVMDAPFCLTVLDRELVRHRGTRLTDCLGASLCVLDPRVLDRHLDRSRGGLRALCDLCAHYGVPPPDARDVTAAAGAALEVTRAVGRRYAPRLSRLSPAELHCLQAVWHAVQARGPRPWFARDGWPEAVDPAWPLRSRWSPPSRAVSDPAVDGGRQRATAAKPLWEAEDRSIG